MDVNPTDPSPASAHQRVPLPVLGEAKPVPVYAAYETEPLGVGSYAPDQPAEPPKVPTVRDMFVAAGGLLASCWRADPGEPRPGFFAAAHCTAVLLTALAMFPFLRAWNRLRGATRRSS